MRTRACLVLLALGLVAGQAALPADNGDQKQLLAARKLIQQGIPDTAITQYLDPLIARYRAAHRDPGEKVYSAHSMVETLVYSTLDAAAAEKGKSAAPARVSVLSGEWADALQLKAYALVELKRLDEAKATLQEAIALAPMGTMPWNELGAIYQLEKDWPAALDAYEHAEQGADLVTEEDPKRPLYRRALRGKAYVYTEQGRLDDSEALYRQCLELDKEDSGALNELAYIDGLRKRAGNPAPPPSPPAPAPVPPAQGSPAQ